MILEILLVGVSALLLLLSLIVMGLVSTTLGMGPPLVLQRFPAATVVPAYTPPSSAHRAHSPHAHRVSWRTRRYPPRASFKRPDRWRPPLLADDVAAADLRKDRKRSDGDIMALRGSSKTVVA